MNEPQPVKGGKKGAQPAGALPGDIPLAGRKRNGAVLELEISSEGLNLLSLSIHSSLYEPIATLLPYMDMGMQGQPGSEPYHTVLQHAQSPPMLPCQCNSVSRCQLHPAPPLPPMPALPCHRYPRPVWQLQHPHRQHDPAAVNLCLTRQPHGQWNPGAYGGSNAAH
jgi:hypothetical protein